MAASTTSNIMTFNLFKVFATPGRIHDMQKRKETFESLAAQIPSYWLQFMNPKGEKKAEYQCLTQDDLTEDDREFNAGVIQTFSDGYFKVNSAIEEFMKGRDEKFFKDVEPKDYSDELVFTYDEYVTSLQEYPVNEVFVDLPSDALRFFHKISIALAKTPKWDAKNIYRGFKPQDLHLYTFIVTTRIKTKSQSVRPSDWFQWRKNDFKILGKWRSTDSTKTQSKSGTNAPGGDKPQSQTQSFQVNVDKQTYLALSCYETTKGHLPGVMSMVTGIVNNVYTVRVNPAFWQEFVKFQSTASALEMASASA